MFTAAVPLVAAMKDYEFGGMHLATWVLIAIGIFGVVRSYFRVDDRREARKRKFIRAIAACEKIGLVRFAALFESYVVSDRTGLVRDLRRIAVYLRQAGKVEEIAMRVIETAGPLLLDNPLYADRVRKALTTKAKIVTAAPPKPAVAEPTLH